MEPRNERLRLVETMAAAIAGGMLASTTRPLWWGLLGLALLTILMLCRVFVQRWHGPSAPSAAVGLTGLPQGPFAAAVGQPIVRPSSEDPELAVIDAITGLPNRRALQRILDAQCAVAEATDSSVAVLLFEPKHLDLVRNACGLQAARDVLREAGERLRRALGDVGVIGRWEGDDLVVIMPSARVEALPLLLARFRSIVESQPVKLRSGRRLDVKLSAGWAVVPQDGCNGADMVATARSRFLMPVPTQLSMAG